jgi:protein-S-isoprenylcysteine O-methyltransferase Ste14
MRIIKALIGAILFLIVPITVAIIVPHLINLKFHEIHAAGIVLYAGIIVFIFGIAGSAWCCLDFVFVGLGTPAPFASPEKLVSKGLYKYSRNPMYLSVLIVVLGEAIIFKSYRTAIYDVLLFILFNMFVILYEEPALKRKHGDTYENYKKSVSRWISFH